MKYDVAISYASEQTQYASRLADILKRQGLNVFFAPKEQSVIVGENMAGAFNDIFRKQSLLTVLLISEEYIGKDWTMQELSAALDRNNSVDYCCIIPITFGRARTPKLDPDIAYIDADQSNPAEVAAIVRTKFRNIPVDNESEITPKDSSAHIQNNPYAHTVINVSGDFSGNVGPNGTIINR